MKYTKENHIIRLPVIRYRDSADNPTCAVDFYKKEVCAFLRVANFGQKETCIFADDGPNNFLDRRDGKHGLRTGTLIPFKQCPVWR